MKKIQSFLLAAVVAALAGIPAQAQFQTRLQAVINVRRTPAPTPALAKTFRNGHRHRRQAPCRGDGGVLGLRGKRFPTRGMELEQKTTTSTDGAFDFKVSRAAGICWRKSEAWHPLGSRWASRSIPVVGRKTRLELTPPSTLAGTVMDESSKPVANAEVFVTLAVTAGAGPKAGSLSTCFPANRRTIVFPPARMPPAISASKIFRPMPPPCSRFSRPERLCASHRGFRRLRLAAVARGPGGHQIGRGTGRRHRRQNHRARNSQSAAARCAAEHCSPTWSGFSPSAARAGAIRPGRRVPHSATWPRVPTGFSAVFGTNAFRNGSRNPSPVSVESGQTNRGVQLTAVRGGLLEVSVLGKNDRKPLPQVKVNAFRQGGGVGTAPAPAVSGPDGIARLRLLPGDYQVNANDGSMFLAQASASVEAGQTNRVEIEVVGPRKITGIVRTPDGQPAAGVAVQIAGSFGPQAQIKTDANGRFQLEWNQQNFGGQGEATASVLVRDAEHNLAVAEDLEEDSGPLDLKLAPGLTLAGRVEADGKPITNATASLLFWAGNRGMCLSGLARTNTPGQYEIPALPPGRRYGLIVSAPGYGQQQLQNLDISAEPGRQELDPVELKPANLKLAGQVLDVDDNPVAGCNVSLFGPDQPNGNTRTDRDGRFTFEHVCEGAVQLSANNRGSFGNISAEGGDTNVVLRLGQNAGSAPGTTMHRLKGMVADAERQTGGRRPDSRLSQL